ncbi:hypothetical protein MLP_15490 [Microlunatus phosphovorus NM-1]|uniref:Uncharacterized protein n=1 Tax=Microlunatus phosphovorus (strain ATCC 700054 / DSM 10555 / JCM 9379 / NBRC 101784 / NCIMB 13414 / VKM Ac-1990 / NM-1) TaxID=1032480 RepID=F5XR73_MICPN|nr:hypothetical protein MLP_15490 [Microlunatus phosphovorus NM-1]
MLTHWCAVVASSVAKQPWRTSRCGWSLARGRGTVLDHSDESRWPGAAGLVRGEQARVREQGINLIVRVSSIRWISSPRRAVMS